MFVDKPRPGRPKAFSSVARKLIKNLNTDVDIVSRRLVEPSAVKLVLKMLYEISLHVKGVEVELRTGDISITAFD